MSAWNQLEQLLTCPICLDRFRNPKLLPCQHTFCGEPCMEGLVDYARRQIKCPECRAEHRLPYQGVQTFPNNVTLTRFLDLHRNVTGEEPEPVPSMMERCGICSEKSMVERCAHCEKKVCSECKEAHLEILRREISRINTQVRRGLNKINENLQQTEKNCEKLQTNHHQIREEITEIVRRFIKDLKDKEEKLLQELEDFTQSETKGSSKLKEDLEIELSNMTSNCELIEKHVTETEEEWTDVELVEYKEIFMKTLDFLRNFDPDTLDYGKKIKFQTNTDIDMLRRSLIDFGELKITAPINPLSPSNSCSNITSLSLPLNQNALMRSQSDHRLATQFQQRLRQGDVSGSRYLEGRYISSDTERDRNERASSPTSRRGISDRFGRYGDDRDSRSRFLRESDSLVSNWPRPGDSDSSTAPSSHFRSRFMRERERLSGEYNEDSHDSDYGHRSVRFEEPANTPKVKVFETEETTKGPLSGVIKLTDSPHLMQRLHQNEVKQKIKEEELRNAPPPAPAPVPQPVSNLANFPPRPPSRQMSEDEIEKQKKQNKAAEAAAAAAAAAAPPANTTPSQNGQSQVPQSPLNKTPSSPVPKVPSSPSSNSPSRSVPKRIITLQRDSDRPRFGAESPSGPGSRRESSASTTYEDAIDDESSDTSRVNRRKISTEEGNGRAPRVTTSRQISSTPRSIRSPLGKTLSLNQDNGELHSSDSKSLNRGQSQIGTDKSKRTSIGHRASESESSNEESDDETITTGPSRSERLNELPPSVSTLLNRSAAARQESVEARNRSDSPRGKFIRSNTFDDSSRRSSDAYRRDDEGTSSSSSYQRRLIRTPTLEDEPRSTLNEESRYSKYSPSSGYRIKLAKSRSSHSIGNEESGDEDRPTSPLYRGRPSDSAKTSRSGYVYRTREQSPAEEDNNQSASWSQYLKNKYGSLRATIGSKNDPKKSSSVLRSRSSHAIYGKSSVSISDSSDDESPTSTTRRGSRTTDFGSVPPTVYGFPRSMYMQKRKMMMKIGSRGTEPGCFTWPRCVTVGPDNNIVVADSSNHRVQVFDSTGRFMFEFGSYGSAEGEFDCLAGIAVNRIGQFIVSDRYNHRIQVFDPSGKFLRTFGSEGRADGKFSYPWGITTDSLGFIYVCDKENHRVQVFQSDGTFVGKFGTVGGRTGQLEHPHYVAVTNTNKVVVSDCNNHRIQIFDVNGRTLTTFGTEGTDEGQFKFPRGIAVDDQGYIIVGDSGNNRVQIFNPDGSFLKSFGTWGAGDGEFKGLEGLAVSSTGNILVCDRENHRIQIF